MALVSSNIQNARLGVFNNAINLYMVVWYNTPSGNTIVNVKWRVQGDVGWNDVGDITVSSGGVPLSAPIEIVDNPTKGETYEVYLKAATDSVESTFTILVPQLINGGNFFIDGHIYNICGTDEVFLYFLNDFGVGSTLYEDLQLTTPVSVPYATKFDTGDIYNISGGEVISSTGYSCFDWFPSLYVLGASTSLCSGDVEVLYTDGDPQGELEGFILYEDRELTTPVTGNTYVMDANTGIIYNLNTGTGEIGSEAGGCPDFYNVHVVNENSKRTLVGVFGIDNFGLLAPLEAGAFQVGLHTDFEGSIILVLEGGGSCEECGVDAAQLFINNYMQEEIDVQEGTYLFSPYDFDANDVIKIIIKGLN